MRYTFAIALVFFLQVWLHNSTGLLTVGQGTTDVGAVRTPNIKSESASGDSLDVDEDKNISVTASKYKAKCNGSTDDQAAIQAAFDDAQKNNEAVQFPAGTCLTSTITYMGQPFYGAGKNVTIIKGKPGQDVFSTPDSKISLDYGARIHDLTIEVDSTVNAAASATGGNNTFPNRIFGTAGGITPIAARNGGPPAPGPEIFNNSITGSCGGSITSGSTTLTVGCGGFGQLANYYFVGGVITVAGAGVSGGTLSTRVSGVTNTFTLTLASAASTTVTNATVTLTAAAGVAPPWYCGNAGIAIPASDGSKMAAIPNNWKFENIQILNVNGPNASNYSCGIFIQAAPNALIFQDVDVQSLYGGIIEAPPASNNSSYFAWTNDTAQYINVNLKFNIIPMTWVNGSHRTAPSISIYGANIPFTLGLYQFQIPLGISNGVIASATFSRYYDECWSPNSGERARFSGIDQIEGGSVLQCYGNGYVNWDGNDGTVDAQIGAGGVQINGNHNVFHHQWLRTVADKGLDNSVESLGANGSSQRAVYLNRPRNPAGQIDAGFLLANSGAAPFASGNDLLLTCPDFNFAFNNGDGYSAGCTPDAGDSGNFIGNYFHADSVHYPSGFNFGPSSQGAGPPGKLLVVGDRLPQGPIQVVVSARCNAACLTGAVAQDITTGGTVLASTTLKFGTFWTTQVFPMNLSARSVGDNISLSFAPRWGGAATEEDVDFIGFIPYAAGLPLSGATSSWNNNGLPIPANSCVAGPSVGINGAVTTMAITVTPAANPGTGLTWSNAYVSSGTTIQVEVCNVTSNPIIPRATTFNIRLIQ